MKVFNETSERRAEPGLRTEFTLATQQAELSHAFAYSERVPDDLAVRAMLVRLAEATRHRLDHVGSVRLHGEDTPKIIIPDIADADFHAGMDRSLSQITSRTQAALQTSAMMRAAATEPILVRVPVRELIADVMTAEKAQKDARFSTAYDGLKEHRRAMSLDELSVALKQGLEALDERDSIALRHVTLHGFAQMLEHLQDIVREFQREDTVASVRPPDLSGVPVRERLVHPSELYLPPLLRLIKDLLTMVWKRMQSLKERKGLPRADIDPLGREFRDEATKLWLQIRDILELLNEDPFVAKEIGAAVTYDARPTFADFQRTLRRNGMIETREKILSVLGTGIEGYAAAVSIAALL